MFATPLNLTEIETVLQVHMAPPYGFVNESWKFITNKIIMNSRYLAINYLLLATSSYIC